MTVSEVDGGATYRLNPTDRTGFFLGLDLMQLGVVAVGVLGGVLTAVYASVVVGVLAVAVAAVLGFGRFQGVSVLTFMPNGVRWVGSRMRSQGTLFAELDVFGGSAGLDERGLPPALADQQLLAVPAAAFGFPRLPGEVGVAHDARANTYAASLRVSGVQFPVLGRREQDSRLARWGDALGAFIQERSPVVAVRWSEYASPAGMNDHWSYLRDQRWEDGSTPARESYEGLLASAGTRSTRHETIVSVVVNASLVKLRRDHGQDRAQAAIERLGNEVRLFAARLEAADLAVSNPLSPAETARAIRVRLDPSARTALDQNEKMLRDQVAERGLGAVGPLASKLEWNQWYTDQAVHRAFYVHEWPRLDVPAAWMDMLLMFSGAIRTVTLIYEPVPRSQSQRAITRQSSKIDGEIQERAERGFRIGQHHRRAAEAVEERERELVAGYGEFAYAGVVVVTAGALDDLERTVDEVTQVAASVGIDLRPMSGRHDTAMVATLPLAVGLSGRGAR